MKLLAVILILLLPITVWGQKLEDEKNIKLTEPKNKATLDLIMMIEYNHLLGDAGQKAFPTSFLGRTFHLDGDKLIEAFKLEKDTLSYEDLRDHITKKITGRDILNVMIPNQKFTEPINKYTGFAVQENAEDVLLKMHYNHGKLISAILPFYILIGIFGLLLFLNRKKFDNYSTLQFSQTSKFLFSFLIFRLAYDLMYLSYLLIYQFLGKFHNNSFLFYFFLTSDQIVNLIIFHSCLTVFVQGFLTVSNDKNLWYHKDSLVMTLLYALSVTCIKIYLRVKFNDYNEDSLTKFVFNMNDKKFELGYFMIFFTFALRLIIIFLAFKSFQRTYARSQRNWKFLNSFIVIVLAYFLSGYIKFPIFVNFGNLGQALKTELIGEGDAEFVTEAISIPEIFQILTSCRLIYIWREKNSKKEDPEYL